MWQFRNSSFRRHSVAMLCHPHRKMFPVSIWSNRWRHTPYTMSFPGGLNAVDIILTLWVLLRLSTALRYTHHGSKLTRYRHRWQSYWTKKKAIHWDIKPTFPFFGVNLWQGRNCMPNSAASKGHPVWLPICQISAAKCWNVTSFEKRLYALDVRKSSEHSYQWPPSTPTLC